MSDRDLLEKAAKAVGLVFLTNGQACDQTRGNFDWNPLTDDGDALRLAVRLRIDIEHGSPLDNNAYVCSARCGIEMIRDPVSAIEEVDDEAYRAAATRRAITRAAAAIGGLSSDPSKEK